MSRQEIQVEILGWIRSPRHERPLYWLHGPAGAGKSVIAQTIAELGENEGSLRASFFFSRNHGERSHSPEESGCPDFLREYPVQRVARELLPVIIIDGVDECTGISVQHRIIILVASLLEDNFPLQFLIFSRPEPQIRERFANGALWLRLKQLGLDDPGNTCRDIKSAKGPGRIPEDGSAPNDLKKWQGLPIVSRGAAILLMALYLTYLYFQSLYNVPDESEEQSDEGHTIPKTKINTIAAALV
uniref:Nephrocystin 3-like N-terminal domain-containing protein n=1 Tax=Moniliophthora roreri TaxID=221103 RepID=A0A0W0G219_MONRR